MFNKTILVILILLNLLTLMKEVKAADNCTYGERIGASYQIIPACINGDINEKKAAALFSILFYDAAPFEDDELSPTLEIFKPFMNTADYYFYKSMIGEKEKRIEYLQISSQAGGSEAAYQLYREYIHTDKKKALEFLKLASDRGNGSAQFNLANEYLDNSVSPTMKESLALELLEKSAMNGEQQALLRIIDLINRFDKKDQQFWKLIHQLFYISDKVDTKKLVLEVIDWRYFCKKLSDSDILLQSFYSTVETPKDIHVAAKDIILNCIQIKR